jgi:hypothetical protein
MRKLTLIVFAGLSLWFSTQAAHALGFGRIVNATQLGQALNFAAVINVADDEVLPRECVSAEVYSGENKLQPGQVRVTLEPGKDANERSVRVTSFALIDEPVVSVNVTVGCRSKISRKFVAFVDPPTQNVPQLDAGDLPAQHLDSQVAPLLAIVQAASGASAKPADPDAGSGKVRTERRLAAVDPAAASKVHRATYPRHRVASAAHRRVDPPAAKGGARLELEASPAIAARASDDAASAAASATRVAGAAAADVAKVQAQATQDRDRIQQLEQGLERLRGESRAMQDKVAALQAQLRQAEAERYANPVSYALMVLIALLALSVALLWWRQSRGRQTAQWWAPPEAEPLAAPAPAAVIVPRAVWTTADDFSGAAFGAPHTVPVDPRPVPPTPENSRESGPETMPSEVRDLSVEELIDFEQQVDFFVVLGQDEAAIDLLMSQVRVSGGSGPLPYLKLLEIHRRRGDDDAYERIRERFNLRFNASAPEWAADPQPGRSLEDHAELVVRLQQLWSTPRHAMAALEASLFRRDPIEKTTFDLAAYEQLLFLYAIARDLLEFESTGGVVDLLLPLDTDTDAPSNPAVADRLTQPLDLDVSLAAVRPAASRPTPVPALSVEEHASRSAFLEFNELTARPGGSINWR